MIVVCDFLGVIFRYLVNFLMKDFFLLYLFCVILLDEFKMKMILVMIFVSGLVEIRRYFFVNMRYLIVFKK